jgi:nicotinamidase/pyrazinamidase
MVSQVLVMGLATDYCVKFTALDSIQRLGFSTHVIRDGCRGVNLQPGDSDRAFEEMERNNVHLCHSHDLPWER